VISKIKKNARSYWGSWAKRRTPKGNPQTLGSNNIYILPSGFGWVFGILLLSFFSGAINYQISMVFLMTFLLTVIALISAWEAHANLKDLTIKLISLEDAQQGKPAQAILLMTSNNKIRFGMDFQLAKQPKTRLEKIPLTGMQFIVPIETSQRGYFALPPIVISSLFPFGIFRVWGYAYFDRHYYVYPEPISPDFWPPRLASQNDKKKEVQGDSELYDLKQVENPWVQPNLIAWKIAAKGQGWFLKTMSDTEGEYWLFRLNDLPLHDIEKKLQHLSYWLQTAEQNGYFYGLELKDMRTSLGQGEEHLKHCLRQLALYQ